MQITVHTASGAPRGWRVLIGLTLKQIEYQIRYLEASKREHKCPEFLKLNPRGLLPVVVADDRVLRDSLAILAWLDRRFPDRPLFGSTTDEAADIWQLTTECCDHLRGAAADLLLPILVQNIELPEPGSQQLVDLQSAAEKMKAECKYLDGLLQDREFLAGEQPSAVEAVVYPEVRLLQRAREREPRTMQALGFDNLAQLYPRLWSWRERVGAIDGMSKTMPIHW
ncbi:MAG: glutathione S-transferase family protein [Pseudomonadota bacterium]